MLSNKCVKNRIVLDIVKGICKRGLTNNISSSFIVTSGCSDVEIPNVTFPEFISTYHNKYEKFTAAECSVTKRKYTYGEIRSRSSNLAKAFRKIFKLQNGDVVAIILKNIPEYPIADLGVLKANLISTTVSPIFTADEISRQLIGSNAKAVITDVDLSTTVSKALSIIAKKLPMLTIKTSKDQYLPENAIDFHELVSTTVDFPDIQPCSPNDVAFMPYSSGTTGFPKGVEITHRNLVSNILQPSHEEFDYMSDATDNFQEELPAVVPLYHVFGHTMIMNYLPLRGGKMITLPGFSVNSYISLMKEYQKSTIFFMAPPLFLFMIEHDSVKREYLKNARVMSNGAAPLAASDENRFIEKFGDHITIIQGYGLTEMCPVCTLCPKIMENEKVYRGSVGRPIPNTQVKIVNPKDAENTALGPNIRGELLVKGPQLMKGYRNLPEETKKTITDDGWLRTGDTSYYNEQGFLFIVDRFKDLIKVRGNQVAPAEMEGIIRTFPGVADAAVIGIPDKYSGELPRAYIVPKDGTEVDIKLLDQFVTEKVAKYKQLKGGIVVVKEIPKNPSGKILRKNIRDTYLEKGI
ncbi:hypothetical protein WA026_013920 [Henosepilachna vigintioctopunctata]|uniref:Uncharacterized protein n=1 Tax=Henosepilachna vigintioctopunctata TaxID=420089 RepID=A0AAW1U7D2_9CUCU